MQNQDTEKSVHFAYVVVYRCTDEALDTTFQNLVHNEPNTVTNWLINS